MKVKLIAKFGQHSIVDEVKMDELDIPKSEIERQNYFDQMALEMGQEHLETWHEIIERQ